MQKDCELYIQTESKTPAFFKLKDQELRKPTQNEPKQFKKKQFLNEWLKTDVWNIPLHYMNYKIQISIGSVLEWQNKFKAHKPM